MTKTIRSKLLWTLLLVVCLSSNTVGQITSITDCPDSGKNGDPRLNRLKNRTDVPNPTTVQTKTITQIAAIHQPTSWTPRGKKRTSLTALGESKAIQIEGYLLGMTHYPNGAESCNCGLKLESNNDFHLVIGKTKTTAEANSITGEMTPRVRLTHPHWTFDKMKALVQAKAKIRMTGYLLFDTQHAANPLNRATGWEEHPIMLFEVKQTDGSWKNLDD